MSCHPGWRELFGDAAAFAAALLLEVTSRTPINTPVQRMALDSHRCMAKAIGDETRLR